MDGTAKVKRGVVSAVSGKKRRGDVSMFAYKLVCLELVRVFNERGEFGKLEQLGFDVGLKFTERFVRNNPRYTSTLDVIKFTCKDLWATIFGKHVDKLQTNHRGVYVLHDNSFSGVSDIDLDVNDPQALEETKKFMVLPCGLIRGALASLGLKTVVRAEFSKGSYPGAPSCLFNIQVIEDLLPKAPQPKQQAQPQKQ